MLFKAAALQAIAEGRVTLAFRRWTRPAVKAGGQLRTAVGVLEFDSIEAIEPERITASDAAQAGFVSVQDALDSLGSRDGTLYRIRFHRAGEDPRIALRQQPLADAEWPALSRRLQRLAWAPRVLEAIRTHPATRAGDLAQILGVEKDWLKINVRKLKNLGLTESLGTGYRVSPRGAEVLRRLR